MKELLAHKNGKGLPKISVEVLENHLDYKVLEIGEETCRGIRDLSEEQQKKFALGAKSFLIAATKHLVNKLPLTNIILRCGMLLQPDLRLENWTLKAIKTLASKLNVGVDLDKLGDEWRMYQLETIPEDWYMEGEEPQKPIRVDHYWKKVDDLKDAMGEKKFPSVMKVVKTALVLGHGNAEVERGFSESGKSVTDARIRLSEASIDGIRATTDGLKAFKGPGAVPVTKQLLQLGRSAHAHYVTRLEKERKEKEEAQKQLTLKKEEALQMETQKQKLAKEKEDLQSKEKQLERQETAQQDSMEVGDAILKDANEKLQAALKNKDFKEVSVAQAMIEAAQKKIRSAKTRLQQTREQQKSLSKRKQSIIDGFSSQPSRGRAKKS